MWKEKTVTTLVVNERDIKRNLLRNFVTLLHDEFRLGEETDIIEINLSRLESCLFLINQGKYQEVFEDGYTMMMLDDDCFNVVEEFFRKHKVGDADGSDLEIHVVNDEGSLIQRVGSKWIIY
jgi:hypothetical protein